MSTPSKPAKTTVKGNGVKRRAIHPGEGDEGSDSELSDLPEEEGAGVTEHDSERRDGNGSRGGNVMPDFLAKVYEVCHRIPYGKVTSYGHIAKLAGYPNYSRHVGNAMRDLPEGSQVPWHRVISSAGFISPRASSDGLSVLRQKRRLEAEGVVVTTVAGGGVSVGGGGSGNRRPVGVVQTAAGGPGVYGGRGWDPFPAAGAFGGAGVGGGKEKISLKDFGWFPDHLD